eukprot:172772-Rhodomonas_salina.4
MRGVNITFALNPPESRVRITVLVSFVLFAFPSFIGCLYSFNTIRLIDNHDVQIDSPYGEHGVKESIVWEFTFWLFCWLQHSVVQFVLASPADTLYVFGTSFFITVMLLVFCTLFVNQEGDSVSRRFEGPVFIMLSLAYLLVVVQSHIILSKQFTYIMWMTHIASDGMLVFGHIWDKNVLLQTVMNCRWVYVLMACWFNIVLYLAY